mmetsp:Transcript_3528/g.9128  ORF Transcript_3528/g.9128 Transcript_3528/m.9128 type:complete len:283 (+) Transcript_3528:114-962(+)
MEAGARDGERDGRASDLLVGAADRPGVGGHPRPLEEVHPKGAPDRLPVLRDNLLESSVPRLEKDLNLVLEREAGPLAHPLHARHDLARHPLAPQRLVLRHVKDGEHALVALRLHRVGGAAEVERHLDVPPGERVPAHVDAPPCLKPPELLVGQLAHRGRHILHRLAEPLPEHRIVRLGAARHAVALLGRRDELPDVELLLDVSLEVAEVREHLGVLADGGAPLDGHAQRHPPLVPRVPPLLHKGLHAGHLLLHPLVHGLEVGGGEGQVVDAVGALRLGLKEL